jgi:hypothetical protein
LRHEFEARFPLHTKKGLGFEAAHLALLELAPRKSNPAAAAV